MKFTQRDDLETNIRNSDTEKKKEIIHYRSLLADIVQLEGKDATLVYVMMVK